MVLVGQKPGPGSYPVSANVTPQVFGMWVSITTGKGPEGRQSVAHGVSRGIERQPLIISAPAGRQKLYADLSPPPGL